MTTDEVDVQFQENMWAYRPVNQDAVYVYWVRYLFNGDGRGPDDYLASEYYDGDRWKPKLEGEEIPPTLAINGYLAHAMSKAKGDPALATVTKLIDDMMKGAR